MRLTTRLSQSVFWPRRKTDEVGTLADKDGRVTGGLFWGTEKGWEEVVDRCVAVMAGEAHGGVKKRPTGRRPVGRLADELPSSDGVV